MTKNTKIGIGVVSIWLVFCLILVVIFGSSKSDRPSSTVEKEVVSEQQEQPTPVLEDEGRVEPQEPSPTAEASLWKVALTDHNNTVENFYLVVDMSSPNSEDLKAVAMQAKERLCTKQCNIALFRTEKAAQMDNEYSKLLSLAERLEWKKQNAQYMKENELGFLLFENDMFFDSVWADEI